MAFVDIVACVAAMFSEKLRKPLGLEPVKRARWALLVAVLVFIGAIQNVGKDGPPATTETGTEG